LVFISRRTILFIWPAILLIKIKIDYNQELPFYRHFVLRLLYSIYLTDTDPNTAYFYQGRFFELGIGATLAVLAFATIFKKK
jgi:hypothetical protein